MSAKHVNEDVEIVVLAGDSGRTYADADRRRIQQVVLDELLLTSETPYRKVQVEVEHGADDAPQALVASMLRAHTYTADIVRVAVDSEYGVKAVERLTPDDPP